MEAATEPTSEPATHPTSLLVKLTDIKLPHIARMDPYHTQGPGKAALEALEASIQEVGLLHALTVRKNPDGEPPFELVVGFHRYLAMQRLKKTEVQVSVVTYTNDLAYEFAMTMENLCRRDLSALELTWSLGRAKEVYIALHPETKHGAHAKTGEKPTKKAEEKALAFIDKMAAVQQRSRGSIGQYLTLYSKLRLSNNPERYATLLGDMTLADSKKNLEEFATLTYTDQKRVVEHMRENGSLVPYLKAMKELDIVLHPSQPVKKERVLTPSQARARADTEYRSALAEEAIAKTLLERFSPEVQAMIDRVPALKNNVTDLHDFASFDEEGQRAILSDMKDDPRSTYEDAAGGWKRFASLEAYPIVKTKKSEN